MIHQPNLLEMLRLAKRNADGHYHYTITENWLQGRTTYGGLSACLCLDAIIREFPDLPPLRSAQITFVGPVSGATSVQTEVLRRGKSVANVRARLLNEQGIGIEAVFSFGATRVSQLDQTFTRAPEAVAPEVAENFFIGQQRPVFTQNFEFRLVAGARPVSASSEYDMLLWVRHNDFNAFGSADINAYASLLAIADMPPPAVLPMFAEFAPISSMTWMVNFADTPTTDASGWWLLRSTAENAKDGYSSQNMYVWDAQGRLVVTGRQSVAIFY